MRFRFLLLPACAIAFAFLVASQAGAQNLRFTDACEGRLTDDQLDQIREAYEFAYDHVDEMWDEIDTDSSRPASPDKDCDPDELCPYYQQERANYSSVSSTRRARWEDELASVRINCESNRCANNPNTYGFTGFSAADTLGVSTGEKFLVCYGNIRSVANSINSGVSRGGADMNATDAATLAKLAGTITHEVMHQADGWSGHPSGGTNYVNPETAAETVGVAMEHVALSASLKTNVSLDSITWTGSGYRSRVDIAVENENPISGPPGTLPFSGRDRNEKAHLQLLENGFEFEHFEVGPIGGGQSTTFTAELEFDAYGDGDETIEFGAFMDFTDNTWEVDETDNEDALEFDLGVDLTISLRIAGPYASGTRAISMGSMTHPFALQAYRQLTYDVEVTNQGGRTAPPSTIEKTWDDLWTGSRHSTDLATTHAIEPGESFATQVTIDVPVVSGTVVGSTELTLGILGLDDEHLLREETPEDNTASVEIDDAYFAPNYQIQMTALNTTEAPFTAAVVVSNWGAEPGGEAARVAMRVDGDWVDSARVSSLESGEQQEVEFELGSLFFPVGMETCNTYTAEVDAPDWIDETHEDDNTIEYYRCQGVDVDLTSTLEEQGLVDWIDGLVVDDPDLYLDGLHAIEEMNALVDQLTSTDWILGQLGNGPIDPTVVYDAAAGTIDVYVDTTTYYQRATYVPYFYAK